MSSPSGADDGFGNRERVVDTPSQDRPNRERGLAQKYANSGQITTLMLRNIPSMYTQDMLLQEIIECMGSSDSFDFFYLPWDLQNDCNVGYAFVNFRDVASAERCTRIFTNFNFRNFDSRRTCRVYPAHIQGLENNLRHLMDRAVSEAHSHYPIIMWKGEKLKLGKVIAALDGQRALQAPRSAPGRPAQDSSHREGGSVPSWPPPQSMQNAGRTTLSDAIGGLFGDSDHSPGGTSGDGAFAARLRGLMQENQLLSPPASSAGVQLAGGGQGGGGPPPGLIAPPHSAGGRRGSANMGGTSPEVNMLQSLPGLRTALQQQLRKGAPQSAAGAQPWTPGVLPTGRVGGDGAVGVTPGLMVPPASMPGRLPATPGPQQPVQPGAIPVPPGRVAPPPAASGPALGLGSAAAAAPAAAAAAPQTIAGLSEGVQEISLGGPPREIGVSDPDTDIFAKFNKKFQGS